MYLHLGLPSRPGFARSFRPYFIASCSARLSIPRSWRLSRPCVCEMMEIELVGRSLLWPLCCMDRPENAFASSYIAQKRILRHALCRKRLLTAPRRYCGAPTKNTACSENLLHGLEDFQHTRADRPPICLDVQPATVTSPVKSRVITSWRRLAFSAFFFSVKQPGSEILVWHNVGPSAWPIRLAVGQGGEAPS